MSIIGPGHENEKGTHEKRRDSRNNPSKEEQLRRLNQKLKKIKGNDAISRTRKAQLLREIFALQQEED